jgi:hypothetical protein
MGRLGDIPEVIVSVPLLVGIGGEVQLIERFLAPAFSQFGAVIYRHPCPPQPTFNGETKFKAVDQLVRPIQKDGVRMLSNTFRRSPEKVRSFFRDASIEGKLSYADLASHAVELWASTAATKETVSIYCSNAPIVGKPEQVAYLSALRAHTYMPIFVEGITSEAFYMGPAMTKSPVHVEDLAGCSINVNHLGDPKLWVAIPPNQQKKLLDKLGADNVKNFYNKHIFIPPSTLDRWGIGYYTGIQRKGYTVLTFSAHQVSHIV